MSKAKKKKQAKKKFVGKLLKNKATDIASEIKEYKFRVPAKDIQYVLWSQNGKSKQYIIQLNAAKHYPGVNLPLSGNPRVTIRPNSMTRKIVDTTLSVKNVQFAERAHPVCWVGKVRKVSGGKEVEITVSSIIDGGRRHKALVDAKAEGRLQPHHNVKIWLYENYTKKQTVEISASLNDSGALKLEALANLLGTFDFFKKIFPDQTANQEINYGRESKAGAYPIGELVSLLLVGTPTSKYALNSISTDNKTKLGVYKRNRVEQEKLWAFDTIQTLGKVIDYTHMYVAELFAQHDVDRVKSKKNLVFIDRKIQQKVRRKEEYLCYVVGIMRTYLEKKKGQWSWNNAFKKDLETNIRGIVSKTGLNFINDVIPNARNKRFQTDDKQWQVLLKMIKKGKRK